MNLGQLVKRPMNFIAARLHHGPCNRDGMLYYYEEEGSIWPIHWFLFDYAGAQTYDAGGLINITMTGPSRGSFGSFASNPMK